MHGKVTHHPQGAKGVMGHSAGHSHKASLLGGYTQCPRVAHEVCKVRQECLFGGGIGGVKDGEKAGSMEWGRRCTPTGSTATAAAAAATAAGAPAREIFGAAPTLKLVLKTGQGNVIHAG